MNTNRISIIDTLRGITIVSMIGYHFTWDLVYLFGKEIPWMNTIYSYLWQQSICWSFILISGFCWSFGRKPFRRGMEVFLVGFIITVVTVLAMPDERIIFGILTFTGSAMLLTCLLHPLLKKLPAGISLAVCFIVFLMLKQISRGFIGFFFCKIPLPEGIYSNYFTTYLGFPFRGFFSTDYFAILPWFFLFLTGYFLKSLFDEKGIISRIPDLREPVFSTLGRYSLLLYVLHQPLLYGIYVICTKF